MHLHGNAKLVPSNRRLVVARVLEQHWKVGDVAASFGVSERTVYRLLARWRAGDVQLLDRSSAPKRVSRRTPKSVEALIERLRRLRFTSTRIAADLKMAVSTVGAVLARLGLNRLSRLELPEPPNRYCRRHAGELVHLDVKKLGRFDRPGHRVTGRGVPGWRSRKTGWEFVHVAVDDCTRLAYVEILDDERKGSAVDFLQRVVAWFAERGVHLREVMTDNGSCYISHDFAAACRQLRLRHLRTQPKSAPHQRQSGTLHPNAATRMGLRGRLPDQRATRSGTQPQARLLQPPTTPRCPRSPTTGLAAQRRLTNVPGIYS